MATKVTVQIEPPEITFEDVEEFLATDNLFVEYFNYYLALPTFPEPLCFNQTTGGFEVVSLARKELAQQIKAAVRSQRRVPPMYHVVKQHAFRDIPLIPIVPPEGPEKVEIDTAFSVTTLNKEQGIHWVKAERLPTFLQSDCYFEYRLGSLMSQAQLVGRRGEFVLMQVDRTPRPRKVRPKQEEVPVDFKGVMMKNMYVCMGNAVVTDSDVWFSQVQMANRTEVTYAVLSRPVSASRPVLPTQSRPPTSSTSLRRSDSALGSPSKSSVFSSSFYDSGDVLSLLSPDSGFVRGRRHLDDVLRDDSDGVDRKPYTPRPGEPVCVTADSDGNRMDTHTVYYSHKVEATDSESGVDDVEDVEADDSKTDETRVGRGDEGDVYRKVQQTSAPDDDRAEVEMMKNEGGDGKVIVLNSLEDLSAVIVGAVMKKAMAELSRMNQGQVQRDPRIYGIFPKTRYSHISTDMLDNVVAIEKPAHKPPQTATGSPEGRHAEVSAYKKPEESDVDSLLDSEEDYEEQDRPFFRKRKARKAHSLKTRRGLQQFKTFLKGTAGEGLWHLWVDIDRLLLVVSPDEHAQYLSRMRELYLVQGAMYEISSENKVKLGLSDPGKWSVDLLRTVQTAVGESLLLYWAPRFLLQQLINTNPEKYQHYRELLNLRSSQSLCRYSRPTPCLPLRPKSCHPRVQRQVVVQSLCEQLKPEDDLLLQTTSPPVGMRRTYGPSAVEPPGLTATPTQPALVSTATKKPRDFLTAHLKAQGMKINPAQRPLSASMSSRTKLSSAASRPKSARPPTSLSQPRSRPHTAKSTSSSSSDSWESGSIRSLEQRVDREGGAPSERPLTAVNRGRQVSPASSSSTTSTSSSSSEFLGSQRMEALLQALHLEKESGRVFRKFLQRSNNKLWRDALLFWEDVQSYRMMFYQDRLDLYTIKKYAHAIYSKYIVGCSARSIGCPGRVQEDVRKRLNAPQEELFDETEEEVLETLYAAWMASLGSDTVTYDKVELMETKRHLETKSTYVLHLQRSGLIKERPPTPEQAVDGQDDPVYDPAVWDEVPEEFHDYTLEKLVHNRLELEHFKQFLAEKYADTDLKCWMDIEAWRRIPPTDERKREAKAKDIRKNYLTKKYFFGPNSPAGKSGQNQVMQAGGGWGKLLEDRPPSAVLLEAQKFVRERLEKKWLPLFLAIDSFLERQKPKMRVDDVVDDVLIQKRRRSMAVWKMLESRWVSSSKEIFTFRKALMNPVTSQQFRRFVSIKSDNLENDVLFWQEVQKYKQMHHVHTEDSMLTQKIASIINCFIDSQIPPSLQVDLPQEMADRILDRKHERGPYLFREAQLAVFRILFGHWKDFCELRLKLGEAKVLPTVERLRRHAKAREKQKQAELEQRLEQVELPPMPAWKQTPMFAKFAPPKERLRAASAAADSLLHDPFASQDSEGEVEVARDKGEKIEFSYASYMRELHREELLNNIDESIFSSLTDSGSSKDMSQNNISGKHQQLQNLVQQQSLERMDASSSRLVESEKARMNLPPRSSQSRSGPRKIQQELLQKEGLPLREGNATDSFVAGLEETQPSVSKSEGVTEEITQSVRPLTTESAPCLNNSLTCNKENDTGIFISNNNGANEPMLSSSNNRSQNGSRQNASSARTSDHPAIRPAKTTSSVKQTR